VKTWPPDFVSVDSISKDESEIPTVRSHLAYAARESEAPQKTKARSGKRTLLVFDDAGVNRSFTRPIDRW
jgi:hypothetical protein